MQTLPVMAMSKHFFLRQHNLKCIDSSKKILLEYPIFSVYSFFQSFMQKATNNYIPLTKFCWCKQSRTTAVLIIPPVQKARCLNPQSLVHSIPQTDIIPVSRLPPLGTQQQQGPALAGLAPLVPLQEKGLQSSLKFLKKHEVSSLESEDNAMLILLSTPGPSPQFRLPNHPAASQGRSTELHPAQASSYCHAISQEAALQLRKHIDFSSSNSWQ